MQTKLPFFALYAAPLRSLSLQPTSIAAIRSVLPPSTLLPVLLTPALRYTAAAALDRQPLSNRHLCLSESIGTDRNQSESIR